MHSNVYEVSATPIPSQRYARAGNLPDWFYEQICSYAENTDSIQRRQAIRELARFLGPLCRCVGDQLTFGSDLKDSFFRKG